MLLEFTGRRSGRPISVPVSHWLVDGQPTAFTDHAWGLNFTGGAPVTVTHRGRTRTGRGTLVPGPPEVIAAAMGKAMDNGASRTRLGIGSARGHDPTAEELASLGASLGSMIRFDLPP